MLRRALPGLLVAGLLACADAGPPSRASAFAGKNVVLVVVDTLGAKHTHLGEAGPTPNLDRLAAGGVTFRRAYAPAPWTQPSMASLFTGRMPSHHGVQGLLEVLPEDEETLAESFAAAGYRTHGAVSHFLVTRRFGYAQGFHSWNERSVAGHEGITSERLTNHAIQWLEERAGRPRPFFLFLHYFDPHFRYHHHPAFRRTSPGYEGPVRPELDVWDLRGLRGGLEPEDVEYLVELYREEVAYTDHHLGRLFDALAACGLAEDTLVVVTSDHGEELLEHGWIGHTRTLYDELIRVPLVVSLPGTLPPRVVETPVSTVDVAPTLRELVLGRRGVNDRYARSLGGLLQGVAYDEQRPLFAEVAFSPHVEDERAREKVAYKTAVVTEGWKLVHDLVEERFELYAVSGAPEAIEDADLWGRDPERDAGLRALLEAYERSRPHPRGPGDAAGLAADPEDLEELRGLGYVGEEDGD